MSQSLTDTQLVLLSAAAQHPDHLLTPPEALKGSAAGKLASKLLKLGLVTEIRVRPDQPHWREEDGERIGLAITAAGLSAIGIAPEEDEGEPPAPSPAASPNPSQQDDTSSGSQPRTAPRAGSKQALVIDLLSRPKGATIDDLIAATGWLPHTTRAALTGLRHKGHVLTKSKGEDGRTIYRIEPDSPAEPVGADESAA